MSKIRKKLAKMYMFSRTAANIFRLHELAFAKKYLQTNKNYYALDVASGIGLFTDHLLGNCKFAAGLDIKPENVKIANHFKNKNTSFYIANAEQIPHSDSKFDIVISICALEHFSNPQKALCEIRRILKPKGQLLITVDSLQTIQSQEFIEFHKNFCLVCNYYTEDSIKELLNNAGFEIIVLKSLLRSKISAILSVIAFKIMKFSLLFNFFSLFSYPLSIIADFFSNNTSGITIGVYARKK